MRAASVVPEPQPYALYHASFYQELGIDPAKVATFTVTSDEIAPRFGSGDLLFCDTSATPNDDAGALYIQRTAAGLSLTKGNARSSDGSIVGRVFRFHSSRGM